MFALKRVVVSEFFRPKSLVNGICFVSNNYVFQLYSKNESHKQLPKVFGCVKRSFSTAKGGTKREYMEIDDDNDRNIAGQDLSEIFQEISKGDPEKLKKLKLLEFEKAVMKSEGLKVPDRMSLRRWKEFFELPTVTQRKKFLAFLRTAELADKHKKETAAAKRRILASEAKPAYGLTENTMFFRLYQKVLNRALSLRQETHPGIRVVFDCSYQEYMNTRCIRACAKQLQLCIKTGLSNRYPSKMILCNYVGNDLLAELVPYYILSDVGAEFHKESYLDLYPRERIVYLSPHAQEELKFNPNDIFVIGAYVDKGYQVKASLLKAKENNVRCARFPLERYLNWQSGDKCLALNICYDILLSLAFYNDWNMALKHVPSRFLRQSNAY